MTRSARFRLRSSRCLLPMLIAVGRLTPSLADQSPEPVILENDVFKLTVDPDSGAVTSLFVKVMDCELMGEPRLASNFRICLPLDEYQANYIDGMNQKPVSVDGTDRSVTARFSGMASEQGEFRVDLDYTIELLGDQVTFRARLTNHDERAISEFWFPRLGGWTRFGKDRMARLAAPEYMSCGHGAALFKHFPGRMGLGSEAAEFHRDYPGMVMPWWSIHDAGTNRALYLGYHDQVCRVSTWHTYLLPNSTGNPADAFLTSEQAKGEPVGLVFSHVRYPFIRAGETFDSGEFVLRVHEGDWHQGAKFYRRWFMKHFPFDKSQSWLRKQSAWFTSIIYQPEDRIIADYETYDQWTADAQRYGINTFELIGWDVGGLERGYPEYVPEEKLGGREGFRRLIDSIHRRSGRILPFVNYNILDPNTDLYKTRLEPFTHQDTFGTTPNWMAWGESTLLARKGLTARRHLMASIVPPLEKVLEDYFLDIARSGADGLQIDKLVVSRLLDFNPFNTDFRRGVSVR